MDLTQNYFELFGLPIKFSVDQVQLKQQYRELQLRFHPDKFASKGGSEKRLAEQFSGLINTAYQTLRSPLLTAEYLLLLAGHSVDNENLTIADGAFLFKQMQWREALGDIDISDASKAEDVLESLSREVSEERQQLSARFVAGYNEKNTQECTQLIAKWHFIEKMQNEIERLEDKIFDASA